MFDITKTNVSSRRQQLENNNNKEVEKQRNQQSNFETILQIISMRSQPEDISDPIKEINGEMFLNKKNKMPYWSFTFTVSHNSVFHDGSNELGNLFTDCNGVPMIVGLDEHASVGKVLMYNSREKNIFFEVLND